MWGCGATKKGGIGGVCGSEEKKEEVRLSYWEVRAYLFIHLFFQIMGGAGSKNPIYLTHLCHMIKKVKKKKILI